MHWNILSLLMYHLKLGFLALVWTLPHAEPVPAAGSPCRSRGHSVQTGGPGWESVARVAVGGRGALAGSDVADGLAVNLSQLKLQGQHGTAWLCPVSGGSPKSSVAFP